MWSIAWLFSFTKGFSPLAKEKHLSIEFLPAPDCKTAASAAGGASCPGCRHQHLGQQQGPHSALRGRDCLQPREHCPQSQEEGFLYNFDWYLKNEHSLFCCCRKVRRRAFLLIQLILKKKSLPLCCLFVCFICYKLFIKLLK